MPLYKCEFCNYSTKLKGQLSRHKNTKKHQEKILELENASKEQGVMRQNDPKMTPNDPKMTPNDLKMTPKFACDFCAKKFTTKAHKRRHELNSCKDNEGIMYKKIKTLEKEKKELYKKIDELIEKVGDTNIQNNILIQSYGNEDLSHLTHEIKSELLKLPYGAIPKMIEMVHFNDKMPQNKNIKYPNKKENVLKVFQDNKWVSKDKKETISDLIDSKCFILDEHYETTEEELPIITKKSFTNFKKVYDEGDEEFVKCLKKECDLVLLNNRD
jgi:hypothetical protein